jgi:hypothetical protein
MVKLTILKVIKSFDIVIFKFLEVISEFYDQDNQTFNSWLQ